MRKRVERIETEENGLNQRLYRTRKALDMVNSASIYHSWWSQPRGHEPFMLYIGNGPIKVIFKLFCHRLTFKAPRPTCCVLEFFHPSIELGWYKIWFVQEREKNGDADITRSSLCLPRVRHARFCLTLQDPASNTVSLPRSPDSKPPGKRILARRGRLQDN